jgi:hypothetical protein
MTAKEFNTALAMAKSRRKEWMLSLEDTSLNLIYWCRGFREDSFQPVKLTLRQFARFLQFNCVSGYSWERVLHEEAAAELKQYKNKFILMDLEKNLK